VRSPINQKKKTINSEALVNPTYCSHWFQTNSDR